MTPKVTCPLCGQWWYQGGNPICSHTNEEWRRYRAGMFEPESIDRHEPRDSHGEETPIDIVERLRQWVTDWNGAAMVRGEPPRDGLHCDILYDAADEIDRLRDLVLCLVENDPNELAADGGITVLDVWRNDARQALGQSKA